MEAPDLRGLPLLIAVPFGLTIALIGGFWFWAPLWFCLTLTIVIGLPSMLIFAVLVGSYLRDR